MYFSLLILAVCITVAMATSSETERLVNDPGHLKPLGFGRPTLPVEQYDGFPTVAWFFENHLYDVKPLHMKGAAKLSKAFDLWTDEYFLSQDEPDDHTVTVELKKKENRTFGVEDYSFKKFVSVYNTSDIYMVNGVPPFIAADVMVPGPLQCAQILEEMLVDCVMWFSSGGTKSVVHTDSVENINCLFRGTKELLFVDPKYGNKVDIDHPEGAYSDMDVDRVDFTKYPGMADVEYFRVFMEPGDCLYIPFKWIHQVRSYDSNLAVNVWFDHYLALNTDLDQCPDEFDDELTLDKIELRGFGETVMSIDAMRDHFLDHTKFAPVDIDKTVQIIVGNTAELDMMDSTKGYMRFVNEIFLKLDEDRNQKIDDAEVDEADDEVWEDIIELMQDFDNMYQAMEVKWNEGHGDIHPPNEDPTPTMGKQPRSPYDKHGGEL